MVCGNCRMPARSLPRVDADHALGCLGLVRQRQDHGGRAADFAGKANGPQGIRATPEHTRRLLS